MKIFSGKVKIIALVFSMLLLVAFLPKSFMKVTNQDKTQNEDDICEAKVLSALIDFEEEEQKFAKEKSLPEEDQMRGTIYLTGDFEGMNNQDREKIVTDTLEEIYPDDISKADPNANVVTIIHKREIDDDDEEFISNRQNEDDKMVKIVNKSLNLAKSIVEKKELKGEVPLVIRHFNDTQNGIDTFVISLSKELSSDTDKSEQKQGEQASYYDQENPLVKEPKNIDKLNHLVRLGPKVFMAKSKRQ